MNKFSPFLFALTLLSCHENEDPVQGDNFITALRNGVAWKGTCEMEIDSNDTLRIWGRDREENLHMRVKFDGVGRYELTGRRAWFYQTVGGDVLVSEYTLPAGATGELMITGYDSTSRTLDGTFDINLAKARANPDNNIDHFHFTNGRLLGTISQ